MMRQLALLTFLAVAAAVAVPVANAVDAYGKFLPPDQAFRLTASANPASVVLDWQLADGYYLYRSKFKIVAAHGALGKARFPAGETHNDPNFGQVEVYRHAVEVTLPYKRIPDSRQLALAVTYQGCADAGLCYPPITKQVKLEVPPTGTGAVGATAGSGGGGVSQSEQGHLARLIQNANPLWFMAVFFALGVLLSFTPCVLPMVPILAGVLGKNRLGGAHRGFFLSLVYVLAMAVVYTAAGVAAGYAGTGLQGFFQTPWIIALFAAVFVALALSLFGLYEFSLPQIITNRLSALSGKADGASWGGAAGMGALAALIVSPCIAAPIAGALVVIGQAGEPLRGGMALAALSLGMGAPLIVYGTVAGRLIPKAGRWMLRVERLLGIAMLAYAVWLLGRVVPAPVTLILWGAIGLLAAWMLGVLTRPVFARDGSLGRALGAVVALVGLILLAGGVTGGTSPLAPLAALRAGSQAQTVALNYAPVASVTALEAHLTQARSAGQAVMVEFRADWCTSCLEMEATTLRQPAVRQALAKMSLLKVDVTENTTAQRQLLEYFGLYGPPAYIFFDRCGRRLNAQELVGYTDAEHFLPHLQVSLQSASVPGQCQIAAANAFG